VARSSSPSQTIKRSLPPGTLTTTLTESNPAAYKGILERKPPALRRTTLSNIQLTREALAAYHDNQETDHTIWNSLKNTAIRLRIRQFLYKALHGTQKIGDYWKHITGHEERQTCHSCNSTESMEHVLIHCRAPPTTIIWPLARQLWPHAPHLWPTPSLGIILGCGAIHPPTQQLPNEPQQPAIPTHNRPNKGTTRLLQILLSESAHLIWVLRCERTIQNKSHLASEIKSRWFLAINARLREDKITAARIRRDKNYTAMIASTWEPILSRDSDLPISHNWIQDCEVLVGMRHLRPCP
jgi:ribonuclease HI